MSFTWPMTKIIDSLKVKSLNDSAQAPNTSVVVTGVVTDSRKVTKGCLFVALKGERFDAHDFLADVEKAGAAAVLVQRASADLGIPALVVEDTRVALGELALAWRNQFNIPVIGVTGSNGKTTVKEMIAAILVAEFGADHVLSTQGNLNNEIGVPMTLFRLSGQHKAAVIEMGMNHPGEIALLADVARPTIALVNNAQREHQEFMQSVEAVARENGAVLAALPENGVAVFPLSDTYSNMWHEISSPRKVVAFGLTSEGASVNANTTAVTGTFKTLDYGNELSVALAGRLLAIHLNAAGIHNVFNALAAIASCHAIACSADAMVRGLEAFVPVSGRLQKKRAKNGAVVIDDTYNANPDSVRAAIHVLAGSAGNKILVLGDMGEVGDNGPEFHREIGGAAKQEGINRLLTLGVLAKESTAVFGDGAKHFDQIESLYDYLNSCVAPDATVLVKGSRFMKMERVVSHLLEKV